MPPLFCSVETAAITARRGVPRPLSGQEHAPALHMESCWRANFVFVAAHFSAPSTYASLNDGGLKPAAAKWNSPHVGHSLT